MDFHPLVLVAGGFVLLLAGGEGFVRGSVGIARRLGLSPLLIGLTLVGFGTSTPELLTSVQGALAGSPGIAVGNVVGSNIANILLILGIAAVLQPMLVDRRAFRRDGSVLVLAAGLCLGLVILGNIDRLSGSALVLLLLGYLVLTYRTESRGDAPEAASVHEHEAAFVATSGRRLTLDVLFAIGGLLVTLLGARLLVSGAIDLARAAGVTETLIGLTVVAVGTSLPELVTSVVAAIRRHGDVAFGNILGSNIFNILGILGVTALVSPLAIPPEILRSDIWVMVAATSVLVLFALTGRRLSRGEGAALLAAYAAYVGWLAWGAAATGLSSAPVAGVI